MAARLGNDDMADDLRTMTLRRDVEDVSDVYLLPLADDGAPDVPGGYILLPPPSSPPYVLRFCIEGTSPTCREGSLWTNAPAEGQSFVRDRFREFKYVLSAASQLP